MDIKPEVTVHTDSDGSPSWTRHIGTACVSVGLVCAVLEVLGHVLLSRAVDAQAVAIVGLCLGVPFTGKAIQKFAEK